MKYSVHCQGLTGQFIVVCDANTPKDAKQIVKQQNPNSKILQVTMDVDLKKKI